MSEPIALRHGAFGRAGLYKFDRPMVNHAHRECHLVFFLEGGTAEGVIGNEPVKLDATTAIAVSPMELHRFELTNDKEPCSCLVLHLSPHWILSASKLTALTFEFGQNSVSVTSALARLISRLADLIARTRDAGSLEDLMYEIYLQCYESSWSKSDRAVTGSVASSRIAKSIDLMQSHYLAENNLDNLSKEAGISRPHFFSLFRKEVGITPNIYVNVLRVERAIHDLISTDEPLEQIAFALGFSSQSSFSRFFSQNVGIAPSHYREASRMLNSGLSDDCIASVEREHAARDCPAD